VNSTYVEQFDEVKKIPNQYDRLKKKEEQNDETNKYLEDVYYESILHAI